MMMVPSSRLVTIEPAGRMRKSSCVAGGSGGFGSSSSLCSTYRLNSLSCTTSYNGHGGFLVSKPIKSKSRRRSTGVVINNHRPDDNERSSSSSMSMEKIQEVIHKQALSFVEVGDKEIIKTTPCSTTTTRDDNQSHFLKNLNLLNEAYYQCRRCCAEHSRTYYMGTLLMTPERQKAIWAIYAWCRRTDDLVDEPNASVMITPIALDEWEQRLMDIFEGHPHDLYDAALSDTVSKYPIDIQIFKDLIEGMRLDLHKSRYENFDELYLYCYYVAGTVGLMSVPVMGICPDSKAPTESVYETVLALGVASQLTNILRDVGEDARRGRIYLPQDELALASLSEDDIFRGQVTHKWRNFMKGQIKRARMYYDEAEKGVNELNQASRWPMWASLILYRQILHAIEANDYDNFTKRAYVTQPEKLIHLPLAYARAAMKPSSQYNPAWWLLASLVDEFKFRI